MDSLLLDMNRLRPLPTVAREVRAVAANLVLLGAVLGLLWLLEVTMLPAAVAGGVVALLLLGRLAWRVAQGDVEGPTAQRR